MSNHPDLPQKLECLAFSIGLSVQIERPQIWAGVYAAEIDSGVPLGPLRAYFSGTPVAFAALQVGTGAGSIEILAGREQ